MKQMKTKIKNFLNIQSIRHSINDDIRSMAKLVAGIAPKADKSKTIIIFNASTRITGLSLNAAFSMLTGWSLRLQGIRVINVVCQQGMSRCVLGTNNNDVHQFPPCQKCIRQSGVIYHKSDICTLVFYPCPELAKELKGLPLSELMKFSFDEIPLGKICLPSMRWILRRHHLIDNEETRILYRHYIISGYKVARQFDELMKKVTPISILIFNGMQFPEAVVRWVAQLYEIPAYTYEVGLQPFSAFFTDGDATAYPVNITDDFQLSDAQNGRLDDYLSKRFKGDFSMAGIQFWPEIMGLDDKILEKINSFKQVVPIFTNVIFDTSQPHANVLFPDMFAWLDQVLEVIKAHPETLFVIRAHPDEARPGKASRESVTDWVYERDMGILENVVFIQPEDYFSSYEMIKLAKFVMVYNSTIGLEASIMGAPVLCAGKARFTQLDTVFFPVSRGDYFIKLEEFINIDNIEVNENHRLNARRFLYYQLYKTSLPFDRFLEPDGIWPGFVKLKDFAVEDLLPYNSHIMDVISNGLQKGQAFLL